MTTETRMLLMQMEADLQTMRTAPRRAKRRLPFTEQLESRRLLAGVLSPEINVGVLEGAKTVYGYVNNSTRQIEYHSVTLEAPGTLTAWLLGMTSNADLFLVNDANHNGRIDPGEVVATSTHPGTLSDWVIKSLPAGTYHIGVASRGGTTNYRLSLTADYAGSTLATARNLGTLSSAGASAFDFIGTSDPNDFYRVNLSAAHTLTATLSGMSATEGIQLISDTNKDGIVEPSEILSAATIGRAGGSIQKSLAAGTYFIRVYQASTDSLYRLSLALTSSAPTSTSGLHIVFDYRYDTSGFFTAHPDAKARLNDAAAQFSVFTDHLTALQSSGADTWSEVFDNPSTGQQITVANPTVAANTLVIYIGASSHLQTLELGQAAPGGWTATGDQTWLNTVESRGQAGVLLAHPTDYGPWGGSISFSTLTNWNFSSQPPAAAASDFLSVAIHEIAHVLGFGTSDSWTTYSTASRTFVGPHAEKLNGGMPLALSPDGAHWADGTLSKVGSITQLCEMDPYLAVGQRRVLTALDYAGLEDIGWQTT